MYTEETTFSLARRDNNKKRTYLLVNRLQGKHVPVRPGQALAMFADLTRLIKESYANRRLLLIGFAETATAIGAAVAAELGCDYIQTTRELIAGADYLFFSESHSHATEQKLVKNDLDRIMLEIDCVLFVEDEVTTGNTIQEIISLLKEAYPGTRQYGIASLLNGMSQQRLSWHAENGIPLHYLLKTQNDQYAERAERLVCYGLYDDFSQAQSTATDCYSISGAQNARCLVNGGGYLMACRQLWEEIFGRYGQSISGSILVLGTEEFMFPALFAARQMELLGADVRFHATTRSPILVSGQPGYPLRHRYQLQSFYDRDRTTYIYNLAQYERVFVISDACGDGAGVSSLAAALQRAGNRDIQFIRWCAR